MSSKVSSTIIEPSPPSPIAEKKTATPKAYAIFAHGRRRSIRVSALRIPLLVTEPAGR